jgi:hypothetical protein
MKMKFSCVASILLFLAGCGGTRQPPSAPAGAETTAKTDVLKGGAKLLQDNSPLAPMDVYLVGFHPMKDDPSHQMEAHHYCRQANEDFAQCALFDSNTKEANLTGIEYIISEKLFDTLPNGEKEFWHPHNGEILSGQLVAPGLPEVAEKELMRGKMNSYGKTWHVWMTDTGDKLPLGKPMLAWSFNRDGEAKPGMVDDRDKTLGVNSRELRENRADLRTLAKPQMGVDSLKGKFKRPAQEIPGVVDRNASR